MKKKSDLILGGIAGAFVGAVVYALAHLLIAGWSISGWFSIVMLFLPGALGGAILGVAFPKPFVWLAKLILILSP